MSSGDPIPFYSIPVTIVPVFSKLIDVLEVPYIKHLLVPLLRILLRIRDVYPGSEFFSSRIQGQKDPGSRTRGLKTHRIPDPDPQYWLVQYF